MLAPVPRHGDRVRIIGKLIGRVYLIEGDDLVTIIWMSNTKVKDTTVTMPEVILINEVDPDCEEPIKWKLAPFKNDHKNLALDPKKSDPPAADRLK